MPIRHWDALARILVLVYVLGWWPLETQTLKSDTVPETLILVKTWDKDSGILTAWLPMHRATLTLRYLPNQERPMPEFLPQVGARITWIHRGLNLTTETVKCQGQDMIPVMSAANVVKIGKAFFIVTRVVFEG
jgi:hypothetical protein